MSEGLTVLQGKFVQEYIANGFKDAKNAALRAGATESTAKDAHRNFLGSDTVRKAIDDAKDAFQSECRDELVGSAQMAIRALRDVIDDPQAPHGAKVQAAKSLIELSGVGSQEFKLAGVQRIEVVRVDKSHPADAA